MPDFSIKEITVKYGETVMEVHDQISADLGIAPEQMVLIFKNEVMELHHNVEYYELNEYPVIHMRYTDDDLNDYVKTAESPFDTISLKIPSFRKNESNLKI
jgi:hypothetical protein